ncbi:MAG: GDP-L-fucose synthase [Actinomycetota bacterium]|nr:GDP-L-fucose synthase [Actinomycetota bacterium]
MPGHVAGKRVLVTGGSGFLGSRVCAELRMLDAAEVFVPRSVDYDLTSPGTAERLLADVAPEVIVHLAAEVGGIGANRAAPGRFFYANMVMGVHLIEAARLHGVSKFVQVGTVCSYPKHALIPFREENLWDGYPEETNAPYGIAKKALLVMLQAYREQYGFPGVYLMPVNLYGPGDNFDPLTSHVIPALIRKCEEARLAEESEIACWGTGQASREFLYVADCAQAIALAADHYEGSEPVNLGSGHETTIRELVETTARLTGFTGTVWWDSTKPDGQPRRKLDITRARDWFGFEASTPLEQGLVETIAAYRASPTAVASVNWSVNGRGSDGSDA